MFAGSVGSDVVGLGNLAISGVNFGLAEDIVSPPGPPTGVLGLGYTANEAGPLYYPNYLDVLLESGVINSRTYSVYLGREQDALGSIAFGGLDTTKYEGQLATFNFLPTPINNTSTSISTLITTITAASLTANGTTTTLWSGGSADVNIFPSNNSAVPVNIGLGGPSWNVPDVYYNNAIRPAFPFVDLSGTCSCAYAENPDLYFSLTFAQSNTIRVPASNFIVPFINIITGERIPYGDDGNDTCIFLIIPGDSYGVPYYFMGEAVFRSMYIVYDLDNKQASFAQAASDPGDTPDVVEIPAGPNGVAQAAGNNVIHAPSNTWSVASVSVTVPTMSHTISTLATPIGAPAVMTTAPSVPSGPESSPSASSGSGGGTNTGAIAGGVIGGVVGLAAIAGLLWFLLSRHKRRGNTSEDEGDLQDSRFQHADVPGGHSMEKKGDGTYAVKYGRAELDGGQVVEADGRERLSELPTGIERVELEGNLRGNERL